MIWTQHAAVVHGDGRDVQEVCGRYAVVFMESDSAEDVKSASVKESQLDNVGSEAAVVKA